MCRGAEQTGGSCFDTADFPFLYGFYSHAACPEMEKTR